MSFPEDLVTSVRDNSIALAKMIVETETTERQKKAKEVLDKIYAVASNIFFIGIVITYVVYALLQLHGRHPDLVSTIDLMRRKLSYPILGFALLGIITIFLLVLRGLLYIFKIISAAELAKFYLFIELINLAVQYLYHPQDGPTPILFEMLRKIFDI